MKRKKRKQRYYKADFVGLLTATLRALLPPLMILGILSGCHSIVLSPITGNDIQLLKAGDNFHAPKDGAFLSDYYIQKVMEAKIK